MWEEIIKSVRASLYERTTSPLFGAYAVAWCIWNYKFLLAVFSELPIREKLDLLHAAFFPSAESYAYVFGAPLLGALIFIFLYPYPARYVYEFWRKQQKLLKEVRQKIDDEMPLTKEEAKELRHSLQRLEDEYQREISNRNAEIQRLREELQELQEPIIKRPMTYVVPKRTPKLSVPEEYDPTKTQVEILKKIAGNKDGRLSRNAIVRHMKQSTTKTDFDIGELQNNNLIHVFSSGQEGTVYSITHQGRKILVAGGFA